jgi:hypothetical protein
LTGEVALFAEEGIVALCPFSFLCVRGEEFGGVSQGYFRYKFLDFEGQNR